MSRLVAALLALSVGAAAPSAAQQGPRLGPMAPWFAASVGAGWKQYDCEVCGDRQFEAVMVSGRGGVQLAGGAALLGAEISAHLNGDSRVLFLLASANGLLGRHVMVGGGFGLTGIRTPYVVLDTATTNLIPEGWRYSWGLALQANAEILVPVSRSVAVAPRIAYSLSLDHPLEIVVTGGVIQGNIKLLQVGMAVLWRGTPHP